MTFFDALDFVVFTTIVCDFPSDLIVKVTYHVSHEQRLFSWTVEAVDLHGYFDSQINAGVGMVAVDCLDQ
jgi:hypothetical protein